MKIGDIYKHRKRGTTYEVVALSHKEDCPEQMLVTYKCDFTGTYWTRPLSEFKDGRFFLVKRSLTDFDPFGDIQEFHEYFDLGYDGPPRALPPEMKDFRVDFLHEELDEYKKNQEAAYQETTKPLDSRDHANYTYHLAEALDGLVDLCYVALGNAYIHGFDFKEAWNRVHQANMTKVRAELDTESKRGSSFDVVKPAGWEPPQHDDLVEDNDLFEPHFDRS